MAAPHVYGFITALMIKGGVHSDAIQDDASLLNKKFCINVGAEGISNGCHWTGL